MTASANPILAPRYRSPLQVALDLWRARGSFRGFAEFAIVGAIVLWFLSAPGRSVQTGGFAPPGPMPSQQASQQQVPGEINVLGLKLKPMGVSAKQQSWAPPRLNEIDLQPSYFDKEAEPLRTTLIAALAAYRERRFAGAYQMLSDANADNPRVLLMQGIARIALRGDGDFQTGIALLRKAADRGDAKAMAFLGIMLTNGLPGLTRNVAEGHRLMERAAAAGEVGALRVMGQGYVTGWSDAIDFAKAISYLTKASDRGDVKATFLLAEMYFVGQGVRQDHREAERLMSIAAKAGYLDAQAMLGTWLLLPYASGVTEDPSGALDWLQRAADRMEPHAMLQLGMFYVEYGKRTGHQDAPRGVSVLQRCAEATIEPDCAFAYATALENGIGTLRDLPRAYAFYSIANVVGQPSKASSRMIELKQLLSPQELSQANLIASQVREAHFKRQKPRLDAKFVDCSFHSQRPC
jgi:TPR repeat protein